MTIYRTEHLITSDVTPEWAERVPGADAWRLSWLWEDQVTGDQAVLGMELDELLSDVARVHDERQLARVSACADRLGVTPERAVVLLAERMADRLRSPRYA